MECVPGLVFLSTELIGRIDACFRRMFKYGFCKRPITFYDLSGNYDSTLFKVMLNSHSCIHQLIPSVKNEIMLLRPRRHYLPCQAVPLIV